MHKPRLTGEHLKRRGCKRVCDHNQGWVDRFHAAAQIVLNRYSCIASEWIVHKIGLPIGHPNAVGGAMRSFAAKNKLVVIDYIKSLRPSRHAGMVAVWGRKL